MNADYSHSMTQWDRYNLVVPDRVVNQAMSQCVYPANQLTNLAVEPEDGLNKDFQGQFLDESSCMVCKEIPINAKECAYCNKLICFLCEIRSSFSNGQRVQQRQCPSCNIIEEKNITEVLDDYPGEKFGGVTINGFNRNPGPTLLQPLYRNI